MNDLLIFFDLFVMMAFCYFVILHKQKPMKPVLVSGFSGIKKQPDYAQSIAALQAKVELQEKLIIHMKDVTDGLINVVARLSEEVTRDAKEAHYKNDG